jgi:hypothetical protein
VVADGTVRSKVSFRLFEKCRGRSRYISDQNVLVVVLVVLVVFIDDTS